MEELSVQKKKSLRFPNTQNFPNLELLAPELQEVNQDFFEQWKVQMDPYGCTRVIWTIEDFDEEWT